MQFLRRVLGGHRASPVAPPLALYDSAAAPDSRRADTLLAALDIDAAINAHERWKDRLMDYLEGRTSVGLDPAQVRLKGFIEKLGHLFGHRMCITRMRKTSFGVWSKSAVEGLAARGFPVDCDSIPVIADRFISKECDPDLFDPSNFISY